MMAVISVLRGMLGLGPGRRHRVARILRDGQHTLSSLELELADSMPRRAKGLMGRSGLDGGDGMLFLYPWPRTVRIWMANTLIPLDVMFVDRSGRIVKIAPELQPHSRKWVSSDQAVKWVLEIAGGRAAVLGIQTGDRVEFGP